MELLLSQAQTQSLSRQTRRHPLAEDYQSLATNSVAAAQQSRRAINFSRAIDRESMCHVLLVSALWGPIGFSDVNSPAPLSCTINMI